VTYYLTAADNSGGERTAHVTSDIYFLEVIPTENTFRRAPQMGGMGGMAGQRQQSSSLVQNQKHIIAATWKLFKQRKKMAPDRFERDANVIATSQQEVLQRTRMSLRRLEERFSFSDKSYDKAVIHLRKAVEHMESAAEHLFSRQLEKALDPEQAALRAILKAESESRTTMIQIARNRGNSQGGGGGHRERLDLRELFEMEMGRMENRYELPRQAGVRQQKDRQEDTLEKLRELARRQERLNRRQRDAAIRKDRMSEADNRRRLEELRREQEDLIRQANALSKQISRSSRLTNGKQRGNRVQQLDQAMREMREAARSLLQKKPEAAATKGDKALENLRTAETEEQSAESALRAAGRIRKPEGQEPKSREKQLQQAAVDAGDLKRDLEKLQRQVQALRQSNREKQQDSLQPKALAQGDDLDAARERLQGIKRSAEGFLQPWARGEHWAGNARSIYRALSRKEIEDFLSQPDLWKQLLEPIRELESTLREQAELSRSEKKLFFTQEEDIPDSYRQPIQDYYRALSETKRSR
jgi:hypothetical protein